MSQVVAEVGLNARLSTWGKVLIVDCRGPFFVGRAPDCQREYLFSVEWKPISTAPHFGDLELVVIEKGGPHTIAFPCRRVVGGWIAAETNKWIKVRPAH